MQVVNISVLLFLMLASMSAMGELTLFGHLVSDYVDVDTTNMTSSVNSSAVGDLSPEGETATYYEMSVWSMLGMIVASLQLMLNVIWHSLSIGFYLQSLLPFIPDAFAALMTLGADIIMVLGVVQWYSGRNVRDVR